MSRSKDLIPKFEKQFESVLTLMAKAEPVHKVLKDLRIDESFIAWCMADPDRKQMYEEAQAVGSEILMAETLQIADEADAENIVLTENYPGEVTFVSADISPDTGDNIWNIGTLAPTESWTVIITVFVSTDYEGTIINEAFVDYEDSAGEAQMQEQAVLPPCRGELRQAERSQRKTDHPPVAPGRLCFEPGNRHRHRESGCDQ